MRISPTDFFIVQPALSRVAGRVACLRYLREVLSHFLGEDGQASAGVLEVAGFADGQIQAQRAAEGADDAGGAAEEDLAPAQARPAPHPHASPQQWSPFIAADGRQLRVSARLEPVYEAKSFARIGFRMVRRVMVFGTEEVLTPRQVAMLSTADVLRVDLATIARGIDRLEIESADEQQLSLIVPLSFTSLASQRGRGEFIKQLKLAGALVKLGVICEICDIDGVPPGALLAATSLVRPFALLVVGRLMNTAPGAIVRLEGSGLHALSCECPTGLGDAEFIAWARATITACRRVAKSVLVYGVGSSRQAGTLASLGASHVSLAGGAAPGS